jgi:peptidoglycan/LPS O-acetylase OafA/YrhL
MPSVCVIFDKKIWAACMNIVFIRNESKPKCEVRNFYMKYRAEIDGLRALAVVPVILFHAGFELFSGGFVGVDVFFVISGYLITSILIEDIENQRFSLVSFYERRVRRILPALFCVMLVCIPFAWMWMLPSQMKDFSQSLVAVSLFASNVLFWRKSGYFDAAGEEKPLLHTWSLAVEEQYYVLFPIFLFLAWRYGKERVFWMIVVMASISLLLSEWGWRNNATANFYLAPTRAWELFAGSIAAFIVQKNGVRRNNYLALLGLVAIIFSIFYYDETIPFPSVYALVPVLGVVLLVLYADKETLAARLLSTKAFVGIGLISYSAYLWHYPLLAYLRLIQFEDSLSLASILLFLSTTFLLSIFTWWYVEKPFRMRKLNRIRIILLLIPFLIFNVFHLVSLSSDGFSTRLTEVELNFNKFLSNDTTQEFLEASFKNEFQDVSKTKILIIGDSFASDVFAGFQTKLNNNIDAYEFAFVSIPRRCKNVLSSTPNIDKEIALSDAHCLSQSRVGDIEVDYLIETADIVIVRSLWDTFPTEQMPIMYDYINDLNPGRVVFIGSQIFGEIRFNSLFKIRTIRRSFSETYAYDAGPNNSVGIDSLIARSKALMSGRNYLDAQSVFCSEQCVLLTQQGIPLTSDGYHLTAEGERLLMDRLFTWAPFARIWDDIVH